MSSKVPSRETIKRRTLKEMKELGTHKPQYNRIIEIYSDMIYQYLLALEEFEESGYQYETETAAGGTKKSAIVATLENLRKDILAYSDRLLLNPKSLDSIKLEKGKGSSLAQMLSELG